MKLNTRIVFDRIICAMRSIGYSECGKFHGYINIIKNNKKLDLRMVAGQQIDELKKILLGSEI